MQVWATSIVASSFGTYPGALSNGTKRRAKATRQRTRKSVRIVRHPSRDHDLGLRAGTEDCLTRSRREIAAMSGSDKRRIRQSAKRQGNSLSGAPVAKSARCGVIGPPSGGRAEKESIMLSRASPSHKGTEF